MYLENTARSDDVKQPSSDGDGQAGQHRTIRLLGKLAESFPKIDVRGMDSEAREADLETVEFARRRLVTLTRRLRKAARKELAEAPNAPPVEEIGPAAHHAYVAAQEEAREALKDRPWKVIAQGRGITTVQFSARHVTDDYTITVFAKSLDGLLDGIDDFEEGLPEGPPERYVP